VNDFNKTRTHISYILITDVDRSFQDKEKYYYSLTGTYRMLDFFCSI
jgi:hypothetical protein